MAAVLAATGGLQISFADIRFSARSPQAALIGALVLALAWLALAWRTRAAVSDLRALDRFVAANGQRLAVILATIAGGAAVAFHTFSAAGADASGYLSEAVMLAQGRLTRFEPLGGVANWPDAGSTLSPLGWLASSDLSVQVPTYPIGLPLLMTPLHVMGGAVLASLVGPASLAVAVWSVGRLAHRLAGPPAAILGATWLATSPVALISAMQPMSDMPATAAWLACWVALVSGATGDSPTQVSRAIAAGVAASIAVLVRPNVAPLAAVPLLFLVARRQRAAAVFYASLVAAAAVIVAYVQWRWFGSPLRSHLGTASDIYDPANVLTNARLYAGWLFDTHGPWLFAAPLALVVVRHRDIGWLLAFAALAVAAYLMYAVFEVWTYLRFLLPAIAVAMLAVAATVTTLMSRAPAPLRVIVLLSATLAIGVSQIRSARAHDVFTLRDHHARARLAGHYLDGHLPDPSVIIAGEQSGAMRYYTGRSILRWDLLSLESFVRATALVVDAGYDVWIVLDEWEEDPFRAKFAGTGIGDLDWPPALDAGITLRTRAWRIADRAIYVRGGVAHTDRVR